MELNTITANNCNAKQIQIKQLYRIRDYIFPQTCYHVTSSKMLTSYQVQLLQVYKGSVNEILGLQELEAIEMPRHIFAIKSL